MAVALNGWNLLDDGKHEKIWNLDDTINNVFVVSKMCVMRITRDLDVLKRLEKDLNDEVDSAERVYTRSVCIDGLLWHFVIYCVLSSEISCYNFCFTVKNDFCLLCKSSYDSLEADIVLYNRIG